MSKTQSKYWEIRETAARWLKEALGQPDEGVTLYTVLNHVSQSGMHRHISLYIIKGSVPICLARQAPCNGCGMDMGFELAYNVFLEAYGLNKDYPYQTKLYHHWL